MIAVVLLAATDADGFMLFLLASAPLLLAFNIATFVVFSWIRRGIDLGEKRGEWLMSMARRHPLNAKRTDAQICSAVREKSRNYSFFFGLVFIVVLALSCGRLMGLT